MSPSEVSSSDASLTNRHSQTDSKRSKTRTFLLERDKITRKFKGALAYAHVRDVGPHVPNVVCGLEVTSTFQDFLGAIMGEKFSRRNTPENSLRLFSRLGWWAL